MYLPIATFVTIMGNTSLDICLDLIANQHRRETIRLLRHKGDGEITVDALLDHLSRKDGPINGQPPDRDLLAIQLSHIHLPKLAANGIIEYDPGEGTIRYQPESSVETVLESLPTEPATKPC